MAFISNFNGGALDQQLLAVDARSAQSTFLQGNLFGSLGGAQLSSLDAVFGGVAPLPFSSGLNAPAAFDFSQQMMQVLSQLSSGWAGFAGGAVNGAPLAQPPTQGGHHCH